VFVYVCVCVYMFVLLCASAIVHAGIASDVWCVYVCVCVCVCRSLIARWHK